MILFQSINPYTNTVFAEYPAISATELAVKIAKTENAYRSWKQTSFKQRADLLMLLRQNLLDNKEKYALLITHEMGKHIRESRAEIEKSALVCEFFASNAEEFLKAQRGNTPHESWILFEPIGAVLAIMPWNFPFWQVMRYTTAAIMAGNVSLLKHAPNVMGSALTIERLFIESGFPEGVFQSLLIDTETVESVIAQPIVQAVMLTGSDRAGSAVAALAGKYIKRSIMELGGSDPLLVLNDADIELAAATAVQSRMGNAGQVCIAAKRWLVTEQNAEEFTQRTKAIIEKIKQGNPEDEAIDMGPMARPDLVSQLANQLAKSVEMGAKIETGGVGEGNNFKPTLLTNIKEEMPVCQQEIFGPMASIISFKNENEMVAFANRSQYGLAASIWTKDKEKGLKIASELESGSVYINALVRSDPNLPIGGTKRSGYGRELSAFGIRELCNIKTLIIK
jgi:succinate-semialdehyde dehydrogenase / glutarate-semialdehyde dehydrogenase